MKKLFKSKSRSDSSAGKTDIAQQLVEIKNQLDLLEKKIDSLMTQSRPPQTGKSSFSFQGNRDRGFKSQGMSKATCSECHSECEIPFRPTGNRPVYCKKCFAKRKKNDPSASSSFGRPERSSFDRPERSSFDRPERSSFDRPGRSSSDRPERSSFDRPGKKSFHKKKKSGFEQFYKKNK